VVLELVGLEAPALLVHDVPCEVQHVLSDFDVLDLVEIRRQPPNWSRRNMPLSRRREWLQSELDYVRKEINRMRRAIRAREREIGTLKRAVSTASAELRPSLARKERPARTSLSSEPPPVMRKVRRYPRADLEAEYNPRGAPTEEQVMTPHIPEERSDRIGWPLFAIMGNPMPPRDPDDEDEDEEDEEEDRDDEPPVVRAPDED
jgi:hypothetical protein